MEENKEAVKEFKGGRGGNKTIGAVVIVILVIVGGYFIYKNKQSSYVAVTPTESADGKVSGNYSIKDIMGLNKDLTCTFEQNEGVASVNGTIYVSGKNVRGDFDITGSPVGSIQSHFVTKDNTSYTWTSIANIGYKKAITDTASPVANPQDQASVVGQDDKVDYDCSPWTSDSSKFELPTNITFKDL